MPFEKGRSGNMAGRPPLPSELKESLRSMAPRVLDALETALKSGGNQAMAAAKIILDRGFGVVAQEDAALLERLTKLEALLKQSEEGKLIASNSMPKNHYDEDGNLITHS